MPEAARILALLGAEILVAPRAPESPYSSSEALAGLWQLCQQNQTFGVEAGLSGRAFGRSWDGKAALFAPCEVTPDGSGFLGRSGYLIRDGAAEARADIGELRRIRQDYPLLRQLNPALYRRYLPQLYGGDGP
jgi:predicted amidohydrolase